MLEPGGIHEGSDLTMASNTLSYSQLAWRLADLNPLFGAGTLDCFNRPATPVGYHSRQSGGIMSAEDRHFLHSTLRERIIEHVFVGDVLPAGIQTKIGKPHIS